MINGFINLNKPSTLSSNKALGIVKHSLRECGITEKIGHLGTLDPMATGVLPIAIGRATRLFDYSLDKIKEYEADFIFGANSISLDTDSEVSYSPFKMPKYDLLINAINTQIGEIEQIPPIFSAKSVNGVRAYKLARQGKEVKLNPKKISIYDLSLINSKENLVTLKIKCSGGTYVRAIGRDIANCLGTTAVMSRLVRTKSGFFELNNSITFNEIENEKCNLLNYIINIENYLIDYPRIDITMEEKNRFLNGLKNNNNYSFNKFCAVYCEKELIGIGAQNDEGQLYIKTWLL